MSVDFFIILVAAAGVFALVRIYQRFRKLWQEQDSDWDTKVITKLRAQGTDVFKPHEVSFFLALPDEATGRRLEQRLTGEGFTVDLKSVPENPTHPYSLHAMKALRLSIPDMREHSRRFTEMANAVGGRYDGWTAGVVARGED